MTNESNRTIKVLTTFPTAILERVRSEIPGVELIEIPEKESPAADIEGEVLLIPPWDTGNLAQVLQRGIQWVHAIGTGVDRLPMDLLGDRQLSCARGASSIPIAEWTLAVMLAFEKQLPESWITREPERWSDGQLGTLHGKTLGLVGLGGIGCAAAKHANSFGMQVMAYRRTAQPSPVEGVQMVSELDALLAQSQHIVLALPLTPQSRHLINQQSLSCIPKNAGVHLVNPSRGALVDHDALRTALDDGRIARATLDTVEPEPLPDGHWLYSHPQVKLSPHISWSIPSAFDLLLDTFIDNLKRYRNREPLPGLVDKSSAY